MTITVDIESLDQEGRGVAHADGKVVFVAGALTGERVAIEFAQRKPSYDTARVVTHRARERVARDAALPPLRRLRRLHAAARRRLRCRSRRSRARSRMRSRASAVCGRETLLPPIDGAAWGYRYRARLSVRHVPKKGGVLVGFHERQSSYVADMRECHVLPRKLSDLLVPLRTLIESLSIRDRLPQIEVAIGERLDAAGGMTPSLSTRS